MRQSAVTISLALAGSLLVACAESPDAPRSPAHAQTDVLASCTHVSGSFIFSSFQFTSATTAQGEGWLTGDLAGTFIADYTFLDPPGSNNGGVMRLAAAHTISTAGGTITSLGDILLRTGADGITRPHSQLTINGGTGRFAQATGLLHGNGAVNLFAQPPTGDIDFEGHLCAP